MKAEDRNTCVFIAFFLMAGFLNRLILEDYPLWNSLRFCIHFVILSGLILFWMQSVYDRLLPTTVRTYMLCAASLMLGYMILQSFKYRMVGSNVILARYAVYGYWIPQILIPTLFLMTGVCIRRGARENGRERMLLLPASALTLLALTNDMHTLVYFPGISLSEFTVNSGTYSYGSGFWLLLGWMCLAGAVGVVLMLGGAWRKNRLLPPLLVAVLWGAAAMFYLLFLEPRKMVPMYRIPEINSFGMLTVFETCVRCRLIPYNENYSGFFSHLDFPAMITDRRLQPAWQTAAPVAVSPEQFTRSLTEPVALKEERVLKGMPIRGGYAFWIEDESELRRENRRLREANDILREETDLIRAENRLREEKARLDAQNLIYEQIAAALYPKQKRIEALLDGVSPETEEFQTALRECCVLNAYSKRKGNLLLLSDEALPIRNQELFLALQESARALKSCGVTAAALGEELAEFPLGEINDLYDTFELVIEAYLPCLKKMTVSLTVDGIRLAMEADGQPPLPDKGLSLECLQIDGTTYVTIHRQPGGAR